MQMTSIAPNQDRHIWLRERKFDVGNTHHLPLTILSNTAMPLLSSALLILGSYIVQPIRITLAVWSKVSQGRGVLLCCSWIAFGEQGEVWVIRGFNRGSDSFAENPKYSPKPKIYSETQNILRRSIFWVSENILGLGEYFGFRRIRSPAWCFRRPTTPIANRWLLTGFGELATTVVGPSQWRHALLLLLF